jgi:CheY-like chemotaxis protein
MSQEPIRVLVVEDDEVSAQAIHLMLTRLGCNVEIAGDGAKAIESFRYRIYDLVLMGWQMPVMDGFEATARIRSMPRGQATPIIGTTAGRDRAECIAAGMNDLMPKPFQIEKLRLILTRWTSWTDRNANPKKCDCPADPATGMTPRDGSRPGW